MNPRSFEKGGQNPSVEKEPGYAELCALPDKTYIRILADVIDGTGRKWFSGGDECIVHNREGMNGIGAKEANIFLSFKYIPRDMKFTILPTPQSQKSWRDLLLEETNRRMT